MKGLSARLRDTRPQLGITRTGTHTAHRLLFPLRTLADTSHSPKHCPRVPPPLPCEVGQASEAFLRINALNCRWCGGKVYLPPLSPLMGRWLLSAYTPPSSLPPGGDSVLSGC